MTGTPPTGTPREVMLVMHTGRPTTRRTAAAVAKRFAAEGIRLRMLDTERDRLDLDLPPGFEPVLVPEEPGEAAGCEVVLVLGGDGTLLRGAALGRTCGVPVLGVNLGHVGFLSEAEEDSLDMAVDAIIARDYSVEERMTIDAVARSNGTELGRTWALNEVCVEKSSRERILEVTLEVDGRPVSSFGCDGVLFATPTGSTAYAFSAGGPVVWPQVEALLLVPSNAHALFARPMVVAPDSALAVEVHPHGSEAILDCDGRRTIALPPGARVELKRGEQPVRMVRLDGRPFADRLVRKFDLPVRGWRGSRLPGDDRGDDD